FRQGLPLSFRPRVRHRWPVLRLPRSLLPLPLVGQERLQQERLPELQQVLPALPFPRQRVPAPRTCSVALPQPARLRASRQPAVPVLLPRQVRLQGLPPLLSSRPRREPVPRHQADQPVRLARLRLLHRRIRHSRDHDGYGCVRRGGDGDGAVLPPVRHLPFPALLPFRLRHWPAPVPLLRLAGRRARLLLPQRPSAVPLPALLLRRWRRIPCVLHELVAVYVRRAHHAHHACFAWVRAQGGRFPPWLPPVRLPWLPPWPWWCRVRRRGRVRRGG